MTRAEYFETAKKLYDIEQMWDYLIESGIATENELCLITAINGYNEETMLDVLYVRTGYRSFEQLETE